jgi:hypothetical protein
VKGGVNAIMNMKHIKKGLIALNTIITGIMFYLGIIWFLGVGLATTNVLCNLPNKESYFLIGHLVGVITICAIPLVLIRVIVKYAINNLEKKGVM